MKCCSEFENILKQNNGSYREIFHNFLEQDFLSTKSSRSKRHGSRSKESIEEAESKTVKNAWLKEKLVPNSPSTGEEEKGKTPMQDVVQKKVESIKVQVQRNIFVQDGGQEDKEEIGKVSGSYITYSSI